MAARVSGMDAAFLEMETPTMHLHVMGVLILDPATSDGALPPERLAALFAERLHLIPPFRRRMVAVPGGLDHPRWIDDAHFDLARHLHHRDLGPRACPTDLERFVGEVASTPLPRDRPLWETWLVDGFADGTVALVTKVHHALMDGAAGGDMMASLFDLEPEPETRVDVPAWEGEEPPRSARLVIDAGPAALQRVAQLPGAIARTLAGLAGSAGAIVAQPSSLASFAPATPFNGRLTAARSVAFSRCALDDLKEVRATFGTTINDVVLAATALSLRGYLLDRGAPVEQPLVASVPVSGHRNADTYGNHTSNMMMSLPVQLDDPAAILRSIHEGAAAAKAIQQAIGPDVMDEWISLMPAALVSAGATAYSSLGLGRLHPPLFNSIVSNVMGPPIPLYLAGARLIATYPMGPLIGNTGLNLTVLSQGGDLDIGVIACPDLVDDVRAIADGFVDAVSDLLAAAGRASPDSRAGAMARDRI